MNEAIKKYYSTYILSKQELSGGVSFKTYLLELGNNKKVIFRAGNDYITSLNERIFIADIFRREQIFYDALRGQLMVDLPKVHVIDSSKRYYHSIFEIYDYMEGVPLNQVILSQDSIKIVYYEIGKIVGKMHKYMVPGEQKIFLRSEKWNVFFAKRLKLRLTPLIRNGLIIQEEIEYINHKCQIMIPTMIKESFLHLDIRFNNFLYTDKISALIDAENFEMGDYLFELARIEVYGLQNDFFIAGYASECPGMVLDRESIIYKMYKFETISFLLNVFMNDLKIADDSTAKLIQEFYEIKQIII